jgi:hypothetical protein
MRLLTLFTLCILLLSGGCNPQKSDLINSVLGNISFIEKYGYEPDESTDDNIRITTHLQYVERLLRAKDVSHLTSDLQNRRLQLLDLLNSYTRAGNYPKNHKYKGQRKSCFIDKDQNICAVGYLVEQTAGRAVAEKINAVYQYANIFEMNNELINTWIASSGLTREECAMIQPAYNFPPPTTNQEESYLVKPVYAISSAVMMGANATFNAMNLIDMAKGKNSKTAPLLGLLTGTTQVTMGAFGFARERELTLYTNQLMLTSQGKLSLFNIGIGTTTILLSSWNLLKQKKMTEKRSSLSIISFPEGNNSNGLGLSYSRTF